MLFAKQLDQRNVLHHIIHIVTSDVLGILLFLFFVCRLFLYVRLFFHVSFVFMTTVTYTTLIHLKVGAVQASGCQHGGYVTIISC